ncbi:FecR family protein [Dysgonomonas massiliensis]|uniref:FecR family protein n=1 Tax=Dysgonomonas massiliensis TaxID=2040292 RepID=UPI000C794DE6|nr:FecR domain-containing protein [Dysgonomonas massiliensis]
MNKDRCLILFERYLLKEASPDEIKELCTFINNDSHLNRWLEDEIKNTSSDIDVNIQMRMLQNIRNQTYNKGQFGAEIKPVQHSYKRYLGWVANIAAILLPIVLIIGIYLYSKPQEIDYLTVSADLGEKASINLPDGSKVAINSGSEIMYSTAYNRNERVLKLQGEAYFDVESDKDKPFIVECGDVKIKVLGTKFGINAYKDENIVSVVLNSGKVEFITPKETLVMKPDDRVSYDKSTQNTTTEQVNAEDYTEWRQNRLRFENETLQNIIKVVSRMHNTDIILEDEQLINQKFTGTIDNTSVQSALKALSLTAPIHSEVKEGVIHLFRDEDKSPYYK